MNRFSRAAAFVLCAAAAVLCACGSKDRGHLLIIGGGLDDGNTLVRGRLIERAGGGRIGVVPTATGVENPGESTREALAPHAPGGVEVLPLTMNDHTNAMDEAVAARVRACSALWFVGGDQNRITSVFRPGAGGTPAYRACLDVLRRGGVIAGTSAGAAMMSDPMITGGSSEDALRGGANLAPGMGFLPGVITDQHFLHRGRLGRLVAALGQTRTHIGLAVNEDSAADINLATLTAEALGERSVVIVDMRRSKRENGGWTNVRLHILSTGDTANLRTGAVTPARPVSRPFLCGDGTPASGPLPRPQAEFMEGDPWRGGLIAEMLGECLARPVIAANRGFLIRASCDGDSRYALGENNKWRTLVNVRVDIAPSSPATDTVP